MTKTTYTFDELAEFIYLNSNLDRQTANMVAKKTWREGFDKNEAIKVVSEILSNGDLEYIEENGGFIEPEKEVEKAMTNKHIFRTFKSDHIKGGAVRMEYCVEYWQNEILGICLAKEFLDEENFDWANDFVRAGTPWVLSRQEGTTRTYRAVGFKSFKDAIEYIILYQEDMGKDPTFLPRGIVIDY